MKSSGPMAIGELAEHFGLATHVLRHWEAVGLLKPGRDAAGRRRYGPDDLVRVAVILNAKEAGLGLDDIREFTENSDPARRRAVLRRHQAALKRRIADAQASLELIEGGLRCEHEDITTCPNFQRLVRERIGTNRRAG